MSIFGKVLVIIDGKISGIDSPIFEGKMTVVSAGDGQLDIVFKVDDGLPAPIYRLDLQAQKFLRGQLEQSITIAEAGAQLDPDADPRPPRKLPAQKLEILDGAPRRTLLRRFFGLKERTV